MYEEDPPTHPPSDILPASLYLVLQPPPQPLSPPTLSSTLQGGNHPPCSPTPGRAAMLLVLSAQELPFAKTQCACVHSMCIVHAHRAQQIQRWWAGSGRLEGCRLHAMKLIDSCKNRGTQSSAKETQYHTARWVSEPAFVRILVQSGISALPAVGEQRHGKVWENVFYRRTQKYSRHTSAMSNTKIMHLWK